MTIDNCECPECGNQFDPTDNCWTVCHNCLQIELPSAEVSHKQKGNCVKKLGSGYRRYSLESAKLYQKKLLVKRRPPMDQDEIIKVIESIEEGDQIIFSQEGYSEVETKNIVEGVEDGSIEALGERRSNWEIWVEDGIPMSKYANHNDPEELDWLEVWS